MKFGVVFPQTESGTDPLAIKDYAQAVEDMGYTFILAYDHVIGANPDRPGGWTGPYTHESSFYEPFVLFSYLAGLTRHIEFATGIIILPQRPAVLVAKQAATVDVLSGGRLRLGIGVGWNRVEMGALGYDFHNRGKRSEEQVIVMRELFTEPLVTFHGEYHTIDDAGLKPMPVQRPIPIWFGGHSDVTLRRMARLGDGWMPNTRTPQDAQEPIAALRGYLAEAGRRTEDFGIDARMNLGRFPQEEWGTYAAGWRELGATHLGVNTMGMGLASLSEHIDALRRFKSEVGV